MCKGNKKCRACALKFSGMAKRKFRNKSANVSLMDVGYVVAGAILNFVAVNPAMNWAVDQLPEEYQDQGKKAVSLVKLGVSGAVVTSGTKYALPGFKKMKLPREAKMFALGVAGASGIEAAYQWSPDEYKEKFVLSGTGDLFNSMGSTAVLQLEIDPSGELSGIIESDPALMGYGDDASVDDDGVALMGSGDMMGSDLML